ncbi:hypothetical protein [Streptomyces sp. NPDC004533]|uniref:hypothetical protein n=1 Tax=Streptomyces sp. NPDC004533 TaxID=3154278 RepID=UPI0033B0D7EC
MTGPTLVTSPAPGAGPLLEIIDTLLAEALLAGRQAAAGNFHRMSPPSTAYQRRRHRVLLVLTMQAEQGIGLRLAGDLPFVVSGPSAQAGAPFAGYTTRWPEHLPSQWVSDLFLRWQISGTDKDEEDDPEQVAGRRAALIDRLLRAALWHCVATDAEDAVPVAVRLIAELATSGQVVDVSAAGYAVALLLRAAGEDTSSAAALARSFTGGALPDSPDQWVRKPLDWPEEPVRTLSRPAQRAVNWLLTCVHGRLDEVRAATDFDSWSTALAAVTCAEIACLRGLRHAVVRLPLGLKSVCAQFEELHADFPTLWVSLEIAGMGEAVRYTRDLEEGFRQRGDTTGSRFARERALLPHSLRNAPQVPAVWLRPSWRTATALVDPWPMLRRVDDPAAYKTTPGTDKELGAHIAQGPRTPDLRTVDSLLGRYPWLDFAHGLRAETFASQGDIESALTALIPALVLAPEQAGGWNLLGSLLHRQGHTAVAGTALRIGRTVERMRDRLHEA